ncbi:MAG: GntR family transcriptional regulator [Spirochaetaceae bacterium]|nr:MAG: GntR family transcriptional regulator [Spirochaetaceae bacterium]
MGTDPLFVQIKSHIEDMILSGRLAPDDQVPSSTQMVKFYQVNHLTVLKGMNMLVDEGIIYKRRGVGMFVCADALDRIRQARREGFVSAYVLPLVREARRLGISHAELLSTISHAEKEDTIHDNHATD